MQKNRYGEESYSLKLLKFGRIICIVSRILALLGLVAAVIAGVIVGQNTFAGRLGWIVFGSVVGGALVVWFAGACLGYHYIGLGQIALNTDSVNLREKRRTDLPKNNQTKTTRLPRSLRTDLPKNNQTKTTDPSREKKPDNAANDDYIDFECPECRERLSFRKEEIESDSYTCPYCGKSSQFSRSRRLN